MNRWKTFGAACAAALFVSAALADTGLQSGPQTGKKIGGAFNPLHCNGPKEGAKACLV